MGTPRTEYRDIGGPADPSPYSTPRPEYRDIAPAADDVPPSSAGSHLLLENFLPMVLPLGADRYVKAVES